MLLQHAGTRIDEQHMLWEKNTCSSIKNSNEQRPDSDEVAQFQSIWVHVE